MLHFDAANAAQTERKKNLGVSTLTLQVVIGMTSKTFGKKVRISRFDDIAMTHPVYGGDTLYAGSEILGKEEYPEGRVPQSHWEPPPFVVGGRLTSSVRCSKGRSRI